MHFLQTIFKTNISSSGIFENYIKKAPVFSTNAVNAVNFQVNFRNLHHSLQGLKLPYLHFIFEEDVNFDLGAVHKLCRLKIGNFLPPPPPPLFLRLILWPNDDVGYYYLCTIYAALKRMSPLYVLRPKK